MCVYSGKVRYMNLSRNSNRGRWLGHICIYIYMYIDIDISYTYIYFQTMGINVTLFFFNRMPNK